jgi:hypothetical protein
MANMNSVYISLCTVHIYNRHCICIALDKFSSIASNEQAAAIDDHGWAAVGGHSGETAAAASGHGGERAAASGSELLSQVAMAVSQLLPRQGDEGLGAAPDLRRWRSCGGGRPQVAAMEVCVASAVTCRGTSGGHRDAGGPMLHRAVQTIHFICWG